MKRIFVLISIIISLSILSINISAASWKYTWSNTVVRIPIGDSINDYKDKPKAQLYKDGVLLTDAVITYNPEGDWMYYLSDVNTSKLGEYEVWYKAYETNKYYPGTCPGYKCKVKFIVEDDVDPKLEIIDSNVKLRRGSEYDFNSNIRVSDNCDTELEVTFNENVEFSKIGVYSVNVYVKDDSDNDIEGSFNIEIYETTKPTIIYKNEGRTLKIPLNGDISLSSYFEAYDEIDGDLSKYINYPTIDNTQLGKKEYEFSVTNLAGLSNSVFVEVEIIDDEAPVINVIDKVITLDYKTDLLAYDFKKHITITDNLEINFENLEIEHNILNEVGSYIVTYKYCDNSFAVIETIEVKMKSFTKPQIITENIICYENEAIDLKNYISVVDESDPNILDSLKIFDENVDYSTAGIYSAEAYALNSSGLSETVTFTITVVVYEEDLSSMSGSNSLTDSNSNNQVISLLDIVLLSAIGILVAVVCVMAMKIKKNKSI